MIVGIKSPVDKPGVWGRSPQQAEVRCRRSGVSLRTHVPKARTSACRNQTIVSDQPIRSAPYLVEIQIRVGLAHRPSRQYIALVCRQLQQNLSQCSLKVLHLQKRHFHIWIYMHAPGTKDVIGLVSHIWSVNNHEQLYMD